MVCTPVPIRVIHHDTWMVDRKLTNATETIRTNRRHSFDGMGLYSTRGLGYTCFHDSSKILSTTLEQSHRICFQMQGRECWKSLQNTGKLDCQNVLKVPEKSQIDLTRSLIVGDRLDIRFWCGEQCICLQPWVWTGVIPVSHVEGLLSQNASKKRECNYESNPSVVHRIGDILVVFLDLSFTVWLKVCMRLFVLVQ